MSIFGMFTGSSEMLIFMTSPMRKLCFRGSGRMLFCTILWSFSRCVSGMQFYPIFADFRCLAGSLSAPVGSHYSSFSATDFQPIFKMRFHYI